MTKLAILALVVVNLVGCVPALEPYGNFIGNAPANLNDTIAADTVKQLVTLYPPASTRFDLRQTTPDAYGTLLVESLRAKGYALFEFKPAPTTETAQPETTTAETLPGLSLRYVLDGPDSTNLYRVMVLVGSTSLTRAYVVQNSAVFPAGAWARKE